MTLNVIIATIIIVLLYDVYAVFKGGFTNTISWVIYSNSLKYPVIPFAAGVLCGHLFASQVC